MTDTIPMAKGQLRSLNRHALWGTVSIAALVGALGYWAATTPLSGSVVAAGSVVADGGARRVQHQEGGIVSAILVRNEDAVRQGQVLLNLDATSVLANLSVIEAQLGEAYVRQARLAAERDGTGQISWTGKLDTLPDAARNHALLEAEEQLRTARAATKASQIAQLEEQAAQLGNEVDGLEAQRDAAADEIAIVSKQLDGLEGLLDRGLVEATRVTELQRQLVRIRADNARLTTEIARTKGAIAEKHLQIAQLEDAFQSEVLTQLQEVGQAIAELEQQRIAARDRLDRLTIRAPITGVVHESLVRTIGGVVSPGETLMQIVPQDERLMMDVRVDPVDIDKLAVEQIVRLRFTSFNARETPELQAKVTRISPDLTRDADSGAQFYQVRVGLEQGELDSLPDGARLIPGMPVDAFFTTGERTALDYLVKPFTDQLTLAFRED